MSIHRSFTVEAFITDTSIEMAKADEGGRRNALRRVWTRWKAVARRIGDFQARILLTFCYFVVVAPFALVTRCGTDPLGIKPGAPRGWRSRGHQEGAPMERAMRQF